MRDHPLDRQMRLARIRRAKHGCDAPSPDGGLIGGVGHGAGWSFCGRRALAVLARRVNPAPTIWERWLNKSSPNRAPLTIARFANRQGPNRENDHVPDFATTYVEDPDITHTTYRRVQAALCGQIGAFG
jgi:hypothetical protein